MTVWLVRLATAFDHVAAMPLLPSISPNVTLPLRSFSHVLSAACGQ
jgi:hypothetical protein